MSIQSVPHSSLPSSRGSLLEQCPPEICKKIFTHACDDDGYTGRSLSLVSRYIHDVSEDIKYRSLAIWSMQQILRCYEALRAKPPHLRRIEHLFISAHEQVRPGQTGPAENYQWNIDMHYVRTDLFFSFPFLFIHVTFSFRNTPVHLFSVSLKWPPQPFEPSTFALLSLVLQFFSKFPCLS